MKSFTREHIQDYQDTINYMEPASVNRDPIHRLFFQDKADRATKSVEGLIFERQAKKEQAAQGGKVPTETETEKQTDSIDIAQNNLIKTMHSKKRSQLSLSQFLIDKEAQS